MNRQFDTNTDQTISRTALFNLSFRIFFLGAGVFSIISISLWSAMFIFRFSLPVEAMTSSQWHAHEMIYGYAMAVIVGFLLTASKNWTGIKTLHGKPLATLFGLWAAARLLFLTGTPFLELAGLFDIAFSIMFIASLSYPIIKAKQWKQLAIVSKVLFLACFNILFYLGALGVLAQGVFWGVYGGLFLVISLILTLGRRVLPFFIEKGVDENVEVSNSKWLDLSNLVLFLSFTVNEVFFNQAPLSAYLALILFVINARRLIGWYTPGIWKKPLLWSLYLSFWFICLGFALYVASHFLGINKFLAIHAFAYGSIGVMTLGMMSRVALGHTGRGIQTPPPAIAYALGILLGGAVIRVLLPLLDSQRYLLWIGLSQALWLISFIIFIWVYLPILSKPRIDGRPG